MTDDTWKRMERYLSWRTNLAMAMTYLNSAIHALEQAEFGLAGLKACPRVNDCKLRQDLGEYEDRLAQIRDILYNAQAKVREDARRDLTGRTDGEEEEE